MKFIKRMRVVPVDHERYFLLNGVTGVVDLIDEAVYQLYLKWSHADAIVPENPFEEEMVANFLQREYIMEPEIENKKIEQLFSDLETSFQKNKPMVSPLFLLTYDCSFRCPYCYEKNLLRKGREQIQRRLTPEVVRALFRIFTERHVKLDTVGLYGGEPLMLENEATVREILQQSIERDLPISITTNGYALDYYAPILATARIELIHVTLDGGPTLHNQKRYTVRKEGTFDQIIKGIRVARQYGLPISLRCNVEMTESEQISDLISALETCGLHQDPGVQLYFAPVSHENEPQCNDKLGKFLDKIDPYITHPVVKRNFLAQVENMASIFFDHLQWAPKYAYCMSQFGRQVFDPWGYIYPCQVLVGNEEQAIGRFDENGIYYNENFPLWDNRTIKSMARCRDCDVALFCGGGCALTSIEKSQPVDDGDCSAIEEKLAMLLPYYYKKYFKNKS